MKDKSCANCPVQAECAESVLYGDFYCRYLREHYNVDVPDTNVGDNQEAKADGGKIRLSLVPAAIVWAIGKVREYGCKKYKDPDNWKRVEAQRYWEAVLRHTLAAWRDFRAIDPESGLPHLWHIATNIAFLIELEWGHEA